MSWPQTPMNRRDFFLLGTGQSRTLDISCQRLYMTFVEAKMNGSADVLIERIKQESTRAHRVRLRETAWLARDDFNAALTPLLDDLRGRGGTVEISS